MTRKSICKFAHNYDLSSAQVEQFRKELAAKPCAILLKRESVSRSVVAPYACVIIWFPGLFYPIDGQCSTGPKGERCLYSHKCPSGLQCPKLPLKTCKFFHGTSFVHLPVVNDTDV